MRKDVAHSGFNFAGTYINGDALVLVELSWVVIKHISTFGIVDHKRSASQAIRNLAETPVNGVMKARHKVD